MRFLLIIVFLICYGSLYPFKFELGSVNSELIQKLFNFQFYKQSYADIVSNIILFVPFGFLALKSIPFGNTRYLNIVLVCLTGFTFAFIIQVAQLWTPDRVPSGADAIWNLFGCVFGALLGKLNISLLSKEWLSKPQTNHIYLYLGVLLVLINWTPFVPSLDFGTVINNLKSLVLERKISVYWVAEKAVLWLVCFYFLAKSELIKFRVTDLFTIVIVTLGGKIFVADSPLTIDHILGAILGCTLWIVGRKFVTDKVVATLLLLLIVGLSFYPFEFNLHTQTFNWLPFSGSLNGNILLNILAMIKKFILYACFVWSVYLVTRNLRGSSLLVSALIFTCEYLQIYFIQSVPEVTDALLVLIAGYALHVYLNTYPSEMEKDLQKKTKQVIPKTETSNQTLRSIKPSLAILSLDGLRAVAALSVFIVHYYQEVELQPSFGMFDLNLWMFNGNTGVALFFILSGFLLSMPFWLSKKNNQSFPSIKQYFLRRAARILPAYYVCLAGVLLIKLLMGSSINFNNIISHAFFLHNHKDYQVLDLNPPFWSLAVEVQFYLLLPLFFFILQRLKFSLSLFIICVAVPSFYLAYLALMKALIAGDFWPISFPLIWPFGVFLESSDGAALRYSTLAHLPHFLLGVAAAAVFILKSAWLSQKNKLCEGFFWIASLAVFVILSTYLDDFFQINYGRYNFPYVPILLALIIITAPFSILGKFFLERPAVLWIGRLSYGIYLYHYLVLNGIGRLFRELGLDVNNHMMMFGLASFATTVIIAYLSYWFIEKPIIQRVKFKNTVPQIIQPLAENIDMTTKQYCRESEKKTFMLKKLALPLIATSILIIMSFGILDSSYFKTNNIKQYSWASNNTNIVFDHHTHSLFSDGNLTVDELAKLAVENGCDAIAITDHSSSKEALSKNRLDEIKLARIFHPNLNILSGVELNPPSYEGREHVNVLFSVEQETAILNELNETLRGKDSKKLTDRGLFESLAAFNSKQTHVLAIYNHPSRKDVEETENKADYLSWSQNLDLFIGLSGAPGHQNSEDIGSYRGKFKTINRWDPAIAQVGSTWDQLLDEGKDVWGAIASSDYHNDKMDYAPCEFSRIHVSAPDKTYHGLMQALNTGTFWASHGRFLSQFKLVAEVSEKQLRISPGESTNIDEGSIVLIQVELLRENNFIGLPLDVELITNCITGKPELLDPIRVPAFGNTVEALIPINNKGKDTVSCYLRSRVKIKNSDNTSYLAYSNNIRFFID